LSDKILTSLTCSFSTVTEPVNASLDAPVTVTVYSPAVNLPANSTVASVLSAFQVVADTLDTTEPFLTVIVAPSTALLNVTFKDLAVIAHTDVVDFLLPISFTYPDLIQYSTI
jgi:hypothetical protein